MMASTVKNFLGYLKALKITCSKKGTVTGFQIRYLRQVSLVNLIIGGDGAAEISAGHSGTPLDLERRSGRDLFEASAVAWFVLVSVGLSKTGSWMYLLSEE